MTLPKTISEDGTLLSTVDVADRLGVHRSTVWHWINTGMLASEKHGNFHGVTEGALKQFRSRYQIEDKPKKAAKRRKRSKK